MRFIVLLCLFTMLISSCYGPMSNRPAPPPKKWYSFDVSGFQLRDALDSLEKTDTLLFYDRFRSPGNSYFSLYMPAGNDTVAFILYISGDYRRWLERSDSSHLALMDIHRARPSPDSMSTIFIDDTLSLTSKENYQAFFYQRVVGRINEWNKQMDKYIIRPLITTDTLNAQWILCKRKNFCDTFWLTSRLGAEWVIADSNIAEPYKYK